MISRAQYSLTQIEYVLAVHQHGHFGRAAEACQVTQPTLSMQIQKLEKDLGITIFDRSKKPILLTEVGEKIIPQMQAILSEARKIEGIIERSEKGTLTGALTLGVIPTIAPYILPRLLPVMEKHYAGIRLKIQELQTHRIISALDRDEIDVGLLATPLHQPKIYEYALYYEPFSVLCQKNHELARMNKVKAHTLKFEDIWLLEEGHCLRTQILDVCSLKKGKSAERSFEFESGSIETLKNLVQSYGGYTLLPALAVENLGSKTALIEFERPVPAREVGLVYQREHYKSPLIEALGEAILKSIPESIRKLRPKDLDVLPVEK